MTDSAAPSVLVLELVGGPLAGVVLRAGEQGPGERHQIGRTRTSKAFQIKDPSISEKHAELAWCDGQWLLGDLGSSNGTFVNGQQLDPEGDPVALKTGDTVQLGQDTVAKVTVEHVLGNGVSVEQYLQGECAQLESQIKARAELLAQQLRQQWEATKQQLLAGVP